MFFFVQNTQSEAMSWIFGTDRLYNINNILILIKYAFIVFYIFFETSFSCIQKSYIYILYQSSKCYLPNYIVTDVHNCAPNARGMDTIREKALKCVYSNHAASYESLLKKARLPSLEVGRLSDFQNF